MRVSFYDVFIENGNGSFTPKGTVQIGGITMGNGVSFTKGVSFSGIDIATYEGYDLEVEQNNGGPIVIKGVYK
jgi:flagellar hook protein FlgE